MVKQLMYSITVTYFAVMCTKRFGRKKPWKLSTIIILQNNACPHTADLMKVTLATVGWEIMNHLSYSRVSPQ
jgi:hypothetical protein